VTVLFCDLVDSTGLGERLDPESLRLILGRYFDEMRVAIERHGGVVEKFIGDAVLAVFGIPRVHEDDALRAIRAAGEMRASLAALNQDLPPGSGEQLRIRVGIDTGEVVAGEPHADDRIVTGDTVNVAARLEQTADPDEIVIGGATYELVRNAVVVEPIGPRELKGKTEPTNAYRLLEVVGDAMARPPRLDSPMVGRERALSLLRNAFEGTVADAACCLVTVLGPAGVGKSRLVEEFLGDVPEAAVYRGRCLPYGEGTTFFPILEIVKQAAGGLATASPGTFRDHVSLLLEDDEHRDSIADRVTQLAGVSDPTGSEEISWAVRRFLEALARQRPVVVVLDDLQWGGAALLELVEHVADFSRGAPLLVLAMARPDLLDVRPGWGGGKLNAFTISLEPLSPEECEVLIGNLLGSTDLDADVRERIADAAGGTPLFVEEMLAKLIDDGLLDRSDGRWVPTEDLSDVPVPATIAALLAARIDQLSADERSVLERAAIGGTHFFAGAVRALSPSHDGVGVDASLTGLLRKDLIRPDRSSLPGEDAYRFRHMLIRDATYEATPKQLRADLHERFASWLRTVAADQITEHEETVGFHLEQALAYRAQLGIDRDPALVRLAVGSLAGAGHRASARLDFLSSSRLLERAAALLPEDDPERVRLMADVGVAMNRIGENRRGEQIFTAVIEQAARSGDVVTESRARIDRLWAVREIDPSLWMKEIGEIDRVIPVLEEHHDDLGLTKALQLLASKYSREGKAGKAEPLLQAALDHARRAGDALEEVEVIAESLFALTVGPTPVGEALQRVDDLTQGAETDLRLDAWALGVRSQLEAMRARFDEARAQVDREEAIHEELGLRWGVLLSTSHRWRIEMLAGQPESAGDAVLARLEGRLLHRDAGTAVSFDLLLGLALLEQGRFSEARDVVERRGGVEGEDRQAHVTWCGIRARTSAERGNRVEAERIARDGVEIAARTDELNTRAESLVHLGWVLRRTGDPDGAAGAIGEALELYERKGNIAAVTLVRSSFPG
jgi:class 3 adenylate cyclase/tetratricopeptide (TPR) repeat protein